MRGVFVNGVMTKGYFGDVDFRNVFWGEFEKFGECSYACDLRAFACGFVKYLERTGFLIHLVLPDIRRG